MSVEHDSPIVALIDGHSGGRALRQASETDLTDEARSGSIRAFEELYRRHAHSARVTARYLLRDHNDADDVVADAFVGVLNAIQNGAGPRGDRFHAYLLACVRNGCHDRCRVRGRSVPVDPADFAKEPGRLEDPECFAEANAVATAFSSLPVPWQRVLWMTAVEDRPLGEVAEELKVKKPAAAALSYRAHQALTEAYLAQTMASGHLTGACAQVAPHLARYVRGHCRTAQRQKVRRHLVTCSACTLLAGELRGVNHSLRGLMIPPAALAAFLFDRSKAHGAAAEAVATAKAAATTGTHVGWPAWLTSTKAAALIAVAAVTFSPVLGGPISRISRTTSQLDAEAGALVTSAPEPPATPIEPAATIVVDANSSAVTGNSTVESPNARPIDDSSDASSDAPSDAPKDTPIDTPIEASIDTLVAATAEQLPVTTDRVTAPPITAPVVVIPALTIPDVTVPGSAAADTVLPVTLPATTAPAATPSSIVATTVPNPTVTLPVVTVVPPIALGAGIDLGAAETFAVLGNAAVTSTGPTSITGDVGSTAGAISGLTPQQVVSGMIHAIDLRASQAQAATAVASAELAGRQATPLTGVELGGRTLGPGTYSAATLTVSGTLVLDGGGDPNALFVFTAGTTLVTASVTHVVLRDGARPCNIFWHVGSSATFGTYSAFAGTVIADVSITATTSASFDGRLLARSGAVTLDSNRVTVPTC